MKIKLLPVLYGILLTVACINNPVNDEDRKPTVKFPEDRTMVYSLREINRIDSTGSLDSIIGVMVVRVGRGDSIRTNPVNRWSLSTCYFTGTTHPTDSVFVWYDYIQETDSFLYSRAYPSTYVEHSGLLMKRALCEQTDSVSALGDSVLIENVAVMTFCTRPSVGRKWVMRPDWLEYECTGKEELTIRNSFFSCFKITGTPLDSHKTVIGKKTYSQDSWVTSSKILRTVITHSLPDTVWNGLNYLRIEQIEESTTTIALLCRSYRDMVLQQGWN